MLNLSQNQAQLLAQSDLTWLRSIHVNMEMPSAHLIQHPLNKQLNLPAAL